MSKRGNKEIKNFCLLYGVTIGSILLGVFTSMVNTRFLTPEHFGDIKLIQNFFSLIGSLSFFGVFFAGAQMLAVSDIDHQRKQIRGGLFVFLIISSIIVVCSSILCGLFCSKPNIKRLFFICSVVSIQPLWQNYMTMVLQGDNYIGRLSLSKILPPVIYLISALILFPYISENSALVVLLYFGIYIIVFGIIIFSTKPEFIQLKPVIIELSNNSKEFGRQLYVGSILIVATNYLGSVILGMISENNIEVGYYSLATSITFPLATLPAIIGTIFYKKFSRQDRIPLKTLLTTIVLTIVSCILFILIIKPMVRLLYTEDYIKAAEYAIWMSSAFCLHGLGDMFNQFLSSHKMGKRVRNASLTSGIIKVVGFSILSIYFGVSGLIITFILSEIVYCMFLAFSYAKLIKQV